MNTIGQTIKQLRRAKCVTQEELAGALNVTYQAVSKWENDTAQPDIMMMPALAAYFGVTIDELFGYKLEVMTNKERLIRYMDKNRILVRGDVDLKNGGKSSYYINTEQFSTNATIAGDGDASALAKVVDPDEFARQLAEFKQLYFTAGYTPAVTD
ncbi:MAG: helix-turn-helix domain-containing protein, partial [Acetatifactor sp.]|nr:helix-turn-helix domain-containing protein [Acetatifactor sp.]